MTTYYTDEPLGSSSAKVLYDNAQNFDHLSNDQVNELWKDRFGVDRLTWHGMEKRYQEKLTSMGWTLMESFQDGAALTRADQALHWKLPDGDGEYYRWDGALPKTVPADSTPATTGGVGPGAWVGIGDAALRSMLASSIGSSMIGLPAGGVLSDTIHSVSVEQWSHLVNVDNDWTNAIQAAIDYMSENGGGYVNVGRGTFFADGIILPKKVIIRGEGMRYTMIKARDGWSGRSVIETQNFNLVTTEPDDPGAYYSGCIGLTVHGNLQNYHGTPSINAGYGVLHFGSDQVFNDFAVIYAPGIGFRTEGSPTNRDKFDTEEPEWAVPFIGQYQHIRIAKCGNDCWHFGGIADAFIDDVEIMQAGYGYVVTDDQRSFMDPNERVACFRTWANVDIGKMHCYGAWTGYGFVAGPNTTLFTIRLKFDHLILESCLIGNYFKPRAVVQGGLLDVHECSGNATVHGGFTKTPVAIFSGASQNNEISSLRLVQTNTSYNGVHILIEGDRNNFGAIDAYRGFLSDGKMGTAIWITGNDNIIKSGSINGYTGTDSEGNASSGVVFASGSRNSCDMLCSNGNTGFRLLSSGSISDGNLKVGVGISIAYSGFSLLPDRYRARVSLIPTGSPGNRDIIYSGNILLNNTDINTIQVPVVLPYIPSSGELSIYLDITATNGSTIYPDMQFIRYDPANSTLSQLTFVYKSSISSPMTGRLSIKLG